MMHHDSTVVVLTNENNKPYKEYNFKKLHDKCNTTEVILPFDTDYKILVKNNNSQRIKLDIDIDGTIISSSGIIIKANSESYIERFIDIAKKLHFTKKTNEQVADPTNKENGFLTIKVVKERPSFIDWTIEDYSRNNPFVKPLINPYPYDVYTNPYPYNPVWYSCSGNTLSGDIGSYKCSAASAGESSLSASCADGPSGKSMLRATSVNISKSPDVSNLNWMTTNGDASLDTGATVEGGKSSQSFSSSYWYGDQEGTDFIFRFKMLGKEVKLTSQEEKDLMEYKRLKAKFEGI